MADKEKPKAEAEAPAAPAKKKGPPMLPIIVGVVMIVEGALVYLAATFMMGGSSQAAPTALEGESEDDGERLVEIPLIEDKFQNMSTGRVWQWQVELVLRVRQKNQERVTQEMERRTAELREGVSRIVRSAQDRHLREPGLETVERQFTTYLNEVFGSDANGVPRVEDVILAKFLGTPSDS